ncbi:MULTISPECIES: lytic murein transglycosylase B [unclassified Pusillimonas]|uniref:lytic murein transglycosylase B n=1 Tax=unclassified Pusillimonas TaxID=2640016 RepID=UPI000B9D16AD|nr:MULTISPECIES: lytic murein transglycosylase B [unclassified Pusillimonas]OXR49785.1 lytic murein transglycosylase B [Pusillimonas sp. T2]ROT45148.1 lytic murein transglycosylase B [Pusillimonas sp. NJUB218]
MFKAARLLQAAPIFAFFTGCASVPPAINTAQADATTSRQETLATAPYAVQLRASLAPSIKAGQSVPGSGPFITPEGQLQPDIQAYAREVAATRNVPQEHVEKLLLLARVDPQVVRLMTPSGKRIKRSWVTYRQRYVEPVRIKQGVTFWQSHKAEVDRAAAQYGVPPSILVSIIGVETLYGRYTGNFSVLDALATLGFRHPDVNRPERSQLFRDQLADLIELDYRGELNATTATGSFAGAIGLPQFMPGSLRRFAADGDNDRRIDLHDSIPDALASVGKFLRLHGWEPGLPVFAPVQLPQNAAQWVDGGLKPTLRWQQLEQAGAYVARSPRTTMAWTQYPVGVIDLLDEPRGMAEYRVATPNFFALTEYNRSYFYATSVAELAQELADRMGYGAPDGTPAQ